MRSNKDSCNRSPMICIPSGSPARSNPHGIEIEGRPARLKGMVNCRARSKSASGASSGSAVIGAVGVMSASNAVSARVAYRTPVLKRNSKHFVVQVIPAVQYALTEPAKWREGARLDAVEHIRIRQRRIVDRQLEGLVALPGDALRHAPARMGRERHAVAAVAQGVEHALARIRLHDARHHVVTDVDPTPP